MYICCGLFSLRESKGRHGKPFGDACLTCNFYFGIALRVPTKGVDLGSQVCCKVTKTPWPQSGPGMDA